MVVLAVSILTRDGKALLSRQFLDMTRMRIEGMLAAFPKLINSNEASGSKRQHTYVETDSVRYLFQPIEDLYLVLITTKGSNIVQDLSSLQLISKILPDVCQPISETTVSEKVFELIFAFDEVMTMGYREDISIQEIRRNLEMESHEEKLHDMLRESKEADARDEMKRKVASIRAAQRDNRDLGGIEGRPSNYEGFGSSTADYPVEPSLAESAEMADYKGFGFEVKREIREVEEVASRLKLGKGMSLRKKKKKGQDVIDDLADEEGIDKSLLERQKAVGKNSLQQQSISTKREDVEIESMETVSISALSDGSITNYEVKGVMSVVCQEGFTDVNIQLSDNYLHSSFYSHFKLTASPKLSKADFSKHLLKLRNDKDFPVTKFSLLNWKMKSTDEELLPLKVIFWPELNGSKANVSVEVNLNDGLCNDTGITDVLIKIPLGRSTNTESFEVISLENGMYRLNTRKNEIEWEIALMNSENPNGLLEFEVDLEDTDCLFPVLLTFSSNQTLLPLKVSRVSSKSGSEVKFSEVKRVEVESFEVLNEA